MAKTSKTMLNKNHENGPPCLVPDLSGNVLSFSLLGTVLALCLSYMAFVMFPLCLLSGDFYHKWIYFKDLLSCNLHIIKFFILNMSFSIFTELCDHSYNLIWDISIIPQKKLVSIFSHSLSPPLALSPRQTLITFCLCRRVYPRHLI